MLAAALLALAVSAADASCGVAQCPMHAAQTRPAPIGSLELGYELEFVDQDRARIAGASAYPGQVRGHHDERYTVSRVHRAKASAELSERWGLDLWLPYVFRSHGHVHHHGGANIEDSWSVGGLGDVAAQARWRFFIPEDPAHPALSLLLGVKAPTGRENLDNDGGEEAETPVQPGSGSWDYTLGLASLQTLSAPSLDGPRDLPLFFSGTYRWNGKGKEDYRLGDVFQLHAGLIYPVVGGLGARAQLDLRVNREDDRGQTREEVGKTGGTALFVSPGLEWALSTRLRAYALAQFPVYQWVQSIQLVSAYNLIGGVAYRLF